MDENSGSRNHETPASEPNAEDGLWDLDSDKELSSPQVTSVGLPPAKLPERREIRSRSRSQFVMTNVKAKSKSVTHGEGSPLSYESKGKPKPDLLRVNPGRLEEEFGDLDAWDDASSVLMVAEPKVLQPGGEIVSNPVGGEDGFVADGQDNEALEDQPYQASRVPLRGIEWIGLVLLALLLGGLAVGGYWLAVHSVSANSADGGAVEFPVTGERVVIKDAVSYWREPNLYGPDRDRVRRGTRLVPEVELQIEGGPAAVRVRIKNEQGRFMGDPLTLMVGESGSQRFTGTVGFEDVGMHAAYRIGEAEPWTYEVQEAESTNSSGDEFTKLFEMEISPDKR